MGTGQHRRKVFSMVKLHRYCGTSEECVPGRFSPIAVATVPRLRCCSVSLFVGFVYVVICTMKLSIEDHHGQQMGTNPMTRTTSPRKRNAVGFRAKQRVRAFDSAQDRVPATCSRLAASTSQPSPAQRARGSGTLVRRARAWLPKLRAPSFPRFLGHVTRPRFPSFFGGQVAAAQVGLQLALLFLPLGCAARGRMVWLFARLHARLSGGWCTVRRKVYTGYTRPLGYLKRWIPTRLGGDLSSVGSVLG
jgi:hypothetical protein